MKKKEMNRSGSPTYFFTPNVKIKGRCFCQKHVEKFLVLTSSAGFQDVSVSFCPCD